jgi:septum formation protein
MNLKEELILASSSPRRKQLLEALGLRFKTQKYEVDESFDESQAPEKTAISLAEKKNHFYRSKNNNEIILTADTIVVYKNQILNKPADKNEAKEMLRKLSGESHFVMTGVCISDKNKSISFVNSTEVLFHSLLESEIEYYIDQFKPYDKAGAYGIQEWIGLACIKSIRGSYFNVVGLPTDEVYHVLQKEFSI